MQQILYLVQKEFRQILRDKMMIRVLIVIPMVQLFILGNAITTEVKDITLYVQDQDRSPMSRALLRSLSVPGYFRIVGIEDDYHKLAHHIDAGQAKLVVVIPLHFQRDVVRGARPKLQVLIDGIDGNSAGVAMGYLQDIVQRFQAELINREPLLGLPLKDLHRVELEPRFWFNPNLESRVYIVPGIVAIILLILTVFLTSMAIVREKEIGTLEQLLVTPIRSYQLVFGKIIPFAVIGFLEIAISMGFVYVVFGIGVKGSIALLFAESAIFILTTLGMGILISTISETQQQALFVGWFFQIFGILLSGFFIPIANMPDAIQYITYINPLRYFLVILREIYLKGSGLNELLPETLAMIGFGVFVFSAAVLRFRLKLK